MDDLEAGKTYSIEWIDGDYVTRCEFIREHNGFLIFIDKHGNKIFCRLSSLKKIKEAKT